MSEREWSVADLIPRLRDALLELYEEVGAAPARTLSQYAADAAAFW